MVCSGRNVPPAYPPAIPAPLAQHSASKYCDHTPTSEKGAGFPALSTAAPPLVTWARYRAWIKAPPGYPGRCCSRPLHGGSRAAQQRSGAHTYQNPFPNSQSSFHMLCLHFCKMNPHNTKDEKSPAFVAYGGLFYRATPTVRMTSSTIRAVSSSPSRLATMRSAYRA